MATPRNGHSSSDSQLRSVPIIDITALTVSQGVGQASEHVLITKDLVKNLHEQGCVGIKGHGIPTDTLTKAFGIMKQFFSLPIESKMQAPHPEGWVPHRGYLWPGFEKAFTKEDMQKADSDGESGEALRKRARQIVDYKESYEIGSDDNAVDYNIWLPEPLLPGFRDFMTRLYWDLHRLCMIILHAIAQGMGLRDSEKKTLDDLHQNGHAHHLRLLHYPPILAEKVGDEMLGRCPVHSDLSTFTLLFQDSCGGLEFEDRNSQGTFIQATPAADTLYLNVGDMLNRLSNDYLPSSNHRVTIPSKPIQVMQGEMGPQQLPDSQSPVATVMPSRYSMPYFFNPADNGWIEPQNTCIEGASDGKSKYTGTVYQDYKAWRMRWIYQK